MKRHIEKPWRPREAYREDWRSSILTRSGTVVTVASPDADDGRALHAEIVESLRQAGLIERAKENEQTLHGESSTDEDVPELVELSG